MVDKIISCISLIQHYIKCQNISPTILYIHKFLEFEEFIPAKCIYILEWINFAKLPDKNVAIPNRSCILNLKNVSLNLRSLSYILSNEMFEHSII